MGDRDQKTSKVETAAMNPVVERQADALRRVSEALAIARATGVPLDRETVDNFLGDAFPSSKKDTKAKAIGELVDGAIDRIKARANKSETPVETPFPLWNEALAGGLWPGVHFLVGGTGVGKTVLTTQLAFHAASMGHAVAIAPIELGAEQTTIRLLGEASGVFWSKLMTGNAQESDLQKVEEARERIASLPILIDDYNPNGWPPSMLDSLCERAGKLAAKQPPGGPFGDTRRAPLVIVDFAQIMGNEENDRLDIRERISTAMYKARAHSQTHGCAVLMVSSVARHGYKMTGGNPKALRDEGIAFEIDKGHRELAGYGLRGAGALVGLGKESGELEYSATSVNVIVRAPSGDGLALAIAKNRFGKASWVPLTFSGAKYSEAREHEAETIAQAFREEKDKVDTSGIMKSGKKNGSNKDGSSLPPTEDFG